MSEANGWIELSQPSPGAKLKLYCFPYAGGAAQVYRLWPRDLPPDIHVCPVQLPGRWTRLREPPFTRMEPLIQAAADALQPTMDRSFVLFGHSLGALVAFELARELRRRGGPLPEKLLVSGRRAPQLPNPFPPMDTSSDDTFIRQMQERYGGIPEEVLASRDLLEILLPTLKADMAVYDNYEHRAEPPLDCPITVYGGEDDRGAREADLRLWQEQTLGPCELRMFPGGHFFLQSARARFFAALNADLAQVGRSSHSHREVSGRS